MGSFLAFVSAASVLTVGCHSFFLPLFPVPDRQYWLEPIRIQPFSSVEGVQSGVVDGITDVIPPLFSTTGRAVFKGILDEVG